jgi:hypothetical protein
MVSMRIQIRIQPYISMRIQLQIRIHKPAKNADPDPGQFNNHKTLNFYMKNTHKVGNTVPTWER